MAGRRCRPAATLLATATTLLVPHAHAADLPFLSPAPAAYYRWEGGYIGGNFGYAFGHSDFGLVGFPATSFGGVIPPVPTSTRAPTNGFVGGLQAGYLHQIDALVFGFEGDFTVTDVSGVSNASGTATGGLGYGLNQRQNVPWLSTLRGRVGWAPNDQYMLYASGGLALGDVRTQSNLTFNNGLTFSGSREDIRAGWAAGVGAEYALSPSTSVTLDYLHFDLGNATVVGLPNVSASFEAHTSAALHGDILRVGFNYRFDHDDIAFAHGFAGLIPQVQTIEAEFGTRYWYSTGTISKTLYDFDGGTMLSRLTYTDLNAGTAEGFARFDDRSTNIFAKAFVGAGSIGTGSLKDEDFPPGISPYSSTNSMQHDGSLLYFAGDVGYNVLWGPNYRVGPFVGWFYQHEIVNAYGCTQTAGNPNVCAPNIPTSALGITENAEWNALRLGIAGEYTWNRFKFSADAAWLPWVTLAATDSHWLRMQPIAGNFIGGIPEDGNGNLGFQLEAIVSYLVTRNFSLGVGARYWRMETRGNAHFEDNIYGGGGGMQAIDFSSERYGGFVQGAFKY
ncbi:MAG TPA: outer membrane beta-barrel protein [Xanthobacteraceae bacterium]|nr:outer membrane beta-barrel protein [Xanthobacteraceae bacterium]